MPVTGRQEFLEESHIVVQDVGASSSRRPSAGNSDINKGDPVDLDPMLDHIHTRGSGHPGSPDFTGMEAPKFPRGGVK